MKQDHHKDWNLNAYQLIELLEPSLVGFHHKEKESYQARIANGQVGKTFDP